ncbi:family 1 glycosylhydrolase [Aestuariivirga sp.]|uniref:family 1 glycosylhydrolase n=1 Tax=Aestuariivirga sp. TaxID=2650926 RepID=UPI0039E65077
MRPLEIWGGIECSVVRIGTTIRNQLTDTGHHERPDDIAHLGRLGLKTLRYPVLWELIEKRLGTYDWRWTDERMALLRAAGISPIATLLHHGAGPAHTSLLDPAFPQKLAGFAERVARRYPWIAAYTPVNEPLTTARFCGLYGHWHPHAQDEATCFRITVNECRAIALAMQAIRRINPAAKLVQTEDFGRISATADLSDQAAYENERRWLATDLLSGRVDEAHPFHVRLLAAGVPPSDLGELARHPCPPDIIGIDYYLTGDRVLDHRLVLHPNEPVGGNGRQSYVDIAAVRSDLPQAKTGLSQRLLEIWDRYRIPLAVTELHNGCSRDEQLRWLMEGWSEAKAARAAGADVRAVTSWSLFGACDWNSLLTRQEGHYECGAFDARHTPPRPTIVAAALSSLITTGRFDHPVLDGAGWWHAENTPQHNARALALAGSGAGLRMLEACCRARRLKTTHAAKSEISSLFDSGRVWAAVTIRHEAPPMVGLPDGRRMQFPDAIETEEQANALLDQIIDASVAQPDAPRPQTTSRKTSLSPEVNAVW